MDELQAAIQSCPIIDHHAHNLLLSCELRNKSLLAATSEAEGAALASATSTLAHYRAIKQLSHVLNCEPTWDSVCARINESRAAPEEAWAKKCFNGIATALIDDGLDRDTVHDVSWHDRLTPYPCKRIARIEVIAQDIIVSELRNGSGNPGHAVVDRFTAAIEAALNDPHVAGFKSVICYRTGLAVPVYGETDYQNLNSRFVAGNPEQFTRLQDAHLNPFFVNLAAKCISRHVGAAKPFQFHTGLGDNDIQLQFSSAALLQPLIEAYPKVKFVILHASYPFTREAGYLACVYDNCFLDIGEVFPMVSQDGQEQVIRQALEICPSEKLCWSTDGHWFPEVREALGKVLGDYVDAGALSLHQAKRCAQDILYITSHRLYQLDLPPLEEFPVLKSTDMEANQSNGDDLAVLQKFMKQNPAVEWLHLQYVDYGSIRRSRAVPIERAMEMMKSRKYVGIQRGVFRMLPNDSMPPNSIHQGEWALKPCLDSLRSNWNAEMATVQCEIQHKDGSELAHDPRSVLRNVLARAKSQHGLDFLVGYEIEVVFMAPTYSEWFTSFQVANLSHGHVWSGAIAIESTKAVELIRSVLDALKKAGVQLEQYHSEGAKSQYEFILAPLPAMAAIDGLFAARAAIESAASAHGLRATLVPKIIGQGFGTGAHMHISMAPDKDYTSFYAGVLQHMRAVHALAMPSPYSYERMGDGLWSGGTWVCWGDQNREACLRRVEDSHWECKVVDGLAHPYLVLAAIIGTGIHGIMNRLRLRGGSVDINPGDLTDSERESLGISERLPKNSEEGLEALQSDVVLRDILGADTIQTFVDCQKAAAEILDSMGKTERMNWLIERY